MSTSDLNRDCSLATSIDRAGTGSDAAPSERSSSSVDLEQEDLPHEDAVLEWWYINGHVKDSEGRDFALFASFFRYADDTGVLDRRFAHAVTWALIELESNVYVSEGLVDCESPAIAAARLERGLGPADPRLQRAIRELLDRGRVPGPDRLMRGPAQESSDRLSLDYDGQTLEKLPDGSYRLVIRHHELAAGFDLRFELDKPVVLHGAEGLVSGSTLNEMFYYFCPRCRVEGTLTLDGRSRAISSGALWYDHEFGFSADEDGSAWSARWNWLATQLDNGWDLTIYDVFERDDDSSPTDHVAVLIAPDGTRHEYREFEFSGDELWTSSKTFHSYPQRWTVRIPAADLELEVCARFPEQEFVTYIAKSPFWEGSVTARGSMAGSEVTGPGFIERAGFGTHDTLEEFFGSVGEATRASVRGILPDEAAKDDLLRITAGEAYPQYVKDVDLEQFRAAIIEPVREIVDRGGKAWRSYCLLACCDAVGGDSQKYLQWLALPELLHVGSLIVDDVQDESRERRGGTACHVQHGVALAINAGNMAYFLPYLGMASVSLPPTEHLAIYDQYFLAIRAAHVGQAMDISGLLDQLRVCAYEGCKPDFNLDARVMATHRLKSAAPAAALARIGAILGGASQAQVHALGSYHEALGLAFQIMDDVLNLTGFERDLKILGEDITAGRVTMPVAVGMRSLDARDRVRIYEALRTGSSDEGELRAIASMLDSCGAMQACRDQARTLVDDAWCTLEPLLPDTLHKVKLRAFGWFVLDRHY